MRLTDDTPMKDNAAAPLTLLRSPARGCAFPPLPPNRCIHGLRHEPSPLRRTGETIPRRRQTSPLLNAMRQNRAPPPAGQPPSKGINCLRLFQQQPAPRHRYG
ncbi:hypothetical protein Dvul_2563 [Nitratidesulfovibrio vulgaris DP4]|uniref:Uncharacterized protein n=1 Tax=Nitratidesulfovibrio vulgaris (strain DP4) TaxID=391774 RepID=A0A0H3AAZ1_NITV4|nr:hypothetical protein Dvul_2563 [Nitratidesulfovibrio vulgaris DP4]